MNTPVFALIVAALAIGEFLLFGALAEAYRDIRQLRLHTGVTDNAQPVDLGRAQNGLPSHHGLPSELDDVAQATVVYLSTTCATCRLIANSLNGGVPKHMWLVVVSESPEVGREWLGGAGFSAAGRAQIDYVHFASVQEVGQHLGTVVTPLAIEVENGALVRARVVPSLRQFYASVPTPLAIGRSLNMEATSA